MAILIGSQLSSRGGEGLTGPGAGGLKVWNLGVMKALIIDDQPLVRFALETILIQQLGFDGVLQEESFSSALPHFERGGHLELTLIDAAALNGPQAKSQLLALKGDQPDCVFVVISDVVLPEVALEVLQLGASGLIAKRGSPGEIAGALDKLLAGQVVIPEFIVREGIDAAGREVRDALWRARKTAAEMARRTRDTRFSGGGDQGVLASYLSVLDHRGDEDQVPGLTDPLTGVANCRLFVERAESALKHARRHHTLLALTYIDLRNLKQLNQTFGYNSGDKVLIEVARRLSGTVREVDTVARLGSDEFILALVDIETRLGVEEAAERIHRALLKPVLLPYGKVWEPDFSMGVTVSEGAEALRQLMNRTDLLMERVKRVPTHQYMID